MDLHVFPIPIPPPTSLYQNMYIIYGETDHQSRLDAWDKRSDLVHWEDLEGSGVQSLKHILIF